MRFGIPRILITNNGTQFEATRFTGFCTELGIDHCFTSTYHPQTNVLAEKANQRLVKGLKKRLKALKGAWVEELYNVLWSYRTTPTHSTDETPFRLMYGSEAIVPVELGFPNHRVFHVNPDLNDAKFKLNLDELYEVREDGDVRMQAFKQRMLKQHNRKVRGKVFNVGDLVLRRADMLKVNGGIGKLQPNWEGLYKVTHVLRFGAYKIATLEGRMLPWTWNT